MFGPQTDLFSPQMRGWWQLSPMERSPGVLGRASGCGMSGHDAGTRCDQGVLMGNPERTLGPAAGGWEILGEAMLGRTAPGHRAPGRTALLGFVTPPGFAPPGYCSPRPCCTGSYNTGMRSARTCTSGMCSAGTRNTGVQDTTRHCTIFGAFPHFPLPKENISPGRSPVCGRGEEIRSLKPLIGH